MMIMNKDILKHTQEFRNNLCRQEWMMNVEAINRPYAPLKSAKTTTKTKLGFLLLIAPKMFSKDP